MAITRRNDDSLLLLGTKDWVLSYCPRSPYVDQESISRSLDDIRSHLGSLRTKVSVIIDDSWADQSESER